MNKVHVFVKLLSELTAECSNRAISTLKVVGDAFRELFPINKGLPPNQPSFFWFFLEEKLYGGHVRQQSVSSESFPFSANLYRKASKTYDVLPEKLG
jgi:hypothetical protein